MRGEGSVPILQHTDNGAASAWLHPICHPLGAISTDIAPDLCPLSGHPREVVQGLHFL